MVPQSQAVAETPSADAPQVSVIIPARNEEGGLGACLSSVLEQGGVSKEVIVVDDGSTDRTAAIAASFPGVRVLSSGALPEGWSGKCNAVCTGAKAATGEWLLFTDADTQHQPGSLAASVAEARQCGVALLSYSPEQRLRGLVQWAVMPAIFAELASTYRPRDVCDPRSPVAAANGQYLLISREAYDAVGGHQAVATSLLEDLELARLVKSSGRPIRLRHGKGLVGTRMYRDTRSLVEGWTKNLALLFPRNAWLATVRLMEFLAIVAGLATLAWAAGHRHEVTADQRTRELVLAGVGLGALCGMRVLGRVRRAHFGPLAGLLAPLGLPIFSYLLLRSRFYYSWRKQITWKGRAYWPSHPQSSSVSRSAPEATSARGVQSST